MKGIKLLLIIGAVLLLLMLLRRKSQKDGFLDNLYGQGETSCKEMCTEQHPEAARMDLDGDNDIADRVMGQCIQECQRSRSKGCSTCS